MTIDDMKKLVKEAHELSQSTSYDQNQIERTFRRLIFVVSELVAREDERVRNGK